MNFRVPGEFNSDESSIGFTSVEKEDDSTSLKNDNIGSRANLAEDDQQLVREFLVDTRQKKAQEGYHIAPVLDEIIAGSVAAKDAIRGAYDKGWDLIEEGNEFIQEGPNFGVGRMTKSTINTMVEGAGILEGLILGGAGFTAGGFLGTGTGLVDFLSAETKDYQAAVDATEAFTSVMEAVGHEFRSGSEMGLGTQHFIGELFLKGQMAFDELGGATAEKLGPGAGAFIRTAGEAALLAVPYIGVHGVGRGMAARQRGVDLKKRQKEKNDPARLDRLRKEREQQRQENNPFGQGSTEGSAPTPNSMGRNAFFSLVNEIEKGAVPDAVIEQMWREYSNAELSKAYPENYLKYDTEMSLVPKKEDIPKPVAYDGEQLPPLQFFVDQGLLTLTPQEFLMTIDNFRAIHGFKKSDRSVPLKEKTVQNYYRKYINSRVPPEYRTQTYPEAVQAAFEIRERELATRKIVEEDRAWREHIQGKDVEVAGAGPEAAQQLQGSMRAPFEEGTFVQRVPFTEKKNQGYSEEQAARWMKGEDADSVANNYYQQLTAEKAKLGESEIVPTLDQSGGAPFTVQPKGGPKSSRFGGRQGGAVNPSVFVEGLVGAGKAVMSAAEFIKEFQKKLPKQYHPLGMTYYQIYKERAGLSSKTGEGVPKEKMTPIELVKSEGAEDVLAGGKKTQDLLVDLYKRRSFFAEPQGKGVGSAIASGTAAQTVGGQAITMVRQLAERAPTARVIADILMRPRYGEGRSQAPGGRSIHQEYALKTADFVKRIDDIYNRFTSPVLRGVKKEVLLREGRGGMTRAQERALNKYMRGYATKEEVGAQIAKVGDELRQVMDELYDYSASVLGTNQMPYQKGYLPRQYVTSPIEKTKGIWNPDVRKSSFKAILEKYGVDAVTAENIYNHLLNHDGRIVNVRDRNRDIKSLIEGKPMDRASALEFERTLAKIPDKELEPFLNNKVYSVITDHIESSVRRVEAARKFGPNDEILADMLKQVITEAAENGKPATLQELQRIYQIVDATRRNLKPMNKTMAAAQKAGISLANMNMLTLSAAASLPEVVLPISVAGYHGIASAIGTFGWQVPKRIARAIWEDMPVASRKSFGEQILEGIYKSANQTALERFGSVGYVDFAKIDTFTFKANGLSYWTRFASLNAVNAFDGMFTSMFKALAKGDKDWYAKNKLDDPNNLSALRALTEYYGIDVRAGVEWYRAGKPTEGPFWDQYRAGALTFAEDFVLAPNPAIVPAWMSMPQFGWLKHLKSFPVLMSNQVMQGMYRRVATNLEKGNYWDSGAFALKSGGAVVAGLMIADLANQFIDFMRYGGENPRFEDNELRAARAIERFGMMGSGSMLFDVAIHSKYNDLEEIIAGPAVGTYGFKMAGKDFWKYVHGNSRPLARDITKYVIPYYGSFGSLEEKEGAVDNVQEFLDSLAFLREPEVSSGRGSRSDRSRL